MPPNEEQLKCNKNYSAPEVSSLMLAWGLSREKANVYQLKQKNCEYGFRYDSLVDFSQASKLRVVDEAEVVFIYAILKSEEDSANHRQVGNNSRKEQHNCKSGQTV